MAAAEVVFRAASLVNTRGAVKNRDVYFFGRP